MYPLSGDARHHCPDHHQVILLVIICVTDRRTNSARLNDMIGWQSRSDCSHHGAPWGGCCDRRHLNDTKAWCCVRLPVMGASSRRGWCPHVAARRVCYDGKIFGEIMMLYWLWLAAMFWLSHCDWSPFGDILMIWWHFDDMRLRCWPWSTVMEKMLPWNWSSHGALFYSVTWWIDCQFPKRSLQSISWCTSHFAAKWQSFLSLSFFQWDTPAQGSPRCCFDNSSLSELTKIFFASFFSVKHAD